MTVPIALTPHLSTDPKELADRFYHKIFIWERVEEISKIARTILIVLGALVVGVSIFTASQTVIATCFLGAYLSAEIFKIISTAAFVFRSDAAKKYIHAYDEKVDPSYLALSQEEVRAWLEKHQIQPHALFTNHSDQTNPPDIRRLIARVERLYTKAMEGHLYNIVNDFIIQMFPYEENLLPCALEAAIALELMEHPDQDLSYETMGSLRPMQRQERWGKEDSAYFVLKNGKALSYRAVDPTLDISQVEYLNNLRNALFGRSQNSSNASLVSEEQAI